MRIPLFAVAAAALALGGCDSFDPLDKFQDWDIMSSKKDPLKGERREVFPRGVPGVPQGVPPEMVKGYQAPPEEPPPVVQAKPERKAKKSADAPPPRKQARKAAPPPEEVEPGDQPMQQARVTGKRAQGGAGCDAARKAGGHPPQRRDGMGLQFPGARQIDERVEDH